MLRAVGLTVAAVLFTALVWAHWPEAALPDGVVADRVVVNKAKRSLVLLRGASELKTYRVSLGRNPVGPKRREGDNRTPEGLYRIAEHKRDSAFHLALRVSYPESRDIEKSRVEGVRPGSDIMVHGLRNGLGWMGRFHRCFDWTAGCIALTNSEIEEIWRSVPDGTVIDIHP
jgi:murein L,D-transpeptidase YafK